MARRECLGLGQRRVAVRVKQADGVVNVVEIDDQLVQDPLVMLDLAGNLAALLQQAGDGVAALYLDLPV
jgi:hypothetical protein